MTRGKPLIVAVCCLVSIWATSNAAAATRGWTVAKAETFLEFGGARVVIPEAITAAKEQLQDARVAGGKFGIENAKAQLAIVTDGFGIDRARCLGSRTADGGSFSSFFCKVDWSDDVIGLQGKATGTLTLNGQTGRWRWRTTTYSARPL